MKTALLFIDLQLGLFQIPGEPIHEADTLLANLAGLMQTARGKSLPIIHVQHCGEKFLLPGTPEWNIHPMVSPQEGEVVIEKRTPDAFHETCLQQTLSTQGITELIIGGLQTEYCIDTTCRRSFTLGYNTRLVRDGHSTLNSRYLTASQIIRHHNQILGDWFVGLCSADEVFNHAE